MKARRKRVQYTIRDVPPAVDRRLREKCASYGWSLNHAALMALRQAVGMEDEPNEFHDLDDLAGTWVNDPAFDAAMQAQDEVDENLWR